jgi:hypothetical protein
VQFRRFRTDRDLPVVGNCTESSATIFFFFSAFSQAARKPLPMMVARHGEFFSLRRSLPFGLRPS